jgi:hypothetical protein
MVPLVRSLVLADLVSQEALAEALFVSAINGIPLVRALLVSHAIDAPRLEQHLERGDAPYMRHVAAVLPLVERLPAGMCERLLAVPVRRDPRTGTVDVAVVDASDPHPAEEIGHWLQAPVRVVRTSLAALDATLRRNSAVPDRGMRSLAPPMWLAREGLPPSDDAYFAASEGTADPHIPFALTRKSMVPPAVVVGPPAIERDVRAEQTDPVLDLRRLKTAASAAAEIVEPPPTLRGPFGDDGVAEPRTLRGLLADIAPILDQIRVEHDRDAILGLVLAGVHHVARRAVVFGVRRGVLFGWTCSPGLADREALRRVQWNAEGSVLANALESDRVRFVRIPPDAVHAPLRSILRTHPATEVALVAVRVDGRPVVVVVADDLLDRNVAAQRLEELARVAGTAIGLALRSRRK